MFASVSENVLPQRITYLIFFQNLTNCLPNPLLKFRIYLVTFVLKRQTQEMNTNTTFIGKIMSLLTYFDFFSFHFLNVSFVLPKHRLMQPVYNGINKLNARLIY